MLRPCDGVGQVDPRGEVYLSRLAALNWWLGLRPDRTRYLRLSQPYMRFVLCPTSRIGEHAQRYRWLVRENRASSHWGGATALRKLAAGWLQALGKFGRQSK
jgi:hypothetical protein